MPLEVGVDEEELRGVHEQRERQRDGAVVGQRGDGPRVAGVVGGQDGPGRSIG